jgi:putative endonuclease
MYYVYILKSNLTTDLYKGSCKDLRKRLECHNSGKVKATQKYKPWQLIYYEAFGKKGDALREERFLKSGKGRERIKHLLTS